MKIYIYIITLLLFNICITSCSKDDNTTSEDVVGDNGDGGNSGNDNTTTVTITVSDFNTTVDENPDTGFSLGTLSATASDNSAISYSLTSQSISGALSVSTTGELTVANNTVFDYETNTQITASFTATSGTVTNNNGSITITIADVDETPTSRSFITKWKTTTTNEDIVIYPNPHPDYANNSYTIDWGDGTIDTNQTGNSTHTYATANTYTVSISGDFPAIDSFYNNDRDNREKLVSIESWGDIVWETMEYAFNGCINLEYNATDTPDLSKATSTKFMFYSAKYFNGAIGNWDVSHVKDMSYMFAVTDSFNQDISNWDVSNVTDMSYMFGVTGSFNQDIGGWDVGSVVNMSGMFSEATAFNQDINGWNVGNVTNMSLMFLRAPIFNQNLNSWDLSSVVDMSYMFDSSSFNGNISSWDVSSVLRMPGMFRFSPFNQDISGWDVSSVVNMSGMFGSATTSFNQNISNWNVSSVADMSFMFYDNPNFNHNISGWTTTGVTDCEDFAGGAAVLTSTNKPSFTNCTE